MAQPPDSISVHTPDNVSVGFATAGLGTRLAAQLIDNLLALFIAYVVVLVYTAIASTASSVPGATFAVQGAVAAFFFVYFGYFLVSEAVSGGGTAGKAALGLRVMRLDGSAPDFVAILIRNVIRVLDVVLFSIGVGLLIMFFHPQSRRLGDIAAGTVVVRERTPVTLATAVAPPTLFISRTPDAGPPVDGIDRLGRSEYLALRTFLSRTGLAADLRSRLAQDIALRLMQRLELSASAPERMWPPELFLERVYLQLDQRMR